jgi:FAD:protein FMN transferase
MSAVVTRHHPVMGTAAVVSVDIDPTDVRAATDLGEWVVHELMRRERQLTSHQPDSDWCRFVDGADAIPSDEVRALLAAVVSWERQTGGRYCSTSRPLSQLWEQAALVGVEPDDQTRLDAVAACRRTSLHVVDGVVVVAGPRSSLDVQAVAKGWIIDRVVEAAECRGGSALRGLTVSVGGDVRHVGRIPGRIAIANPLRPFDNVPPLMTIEVENAGVATSGIARRAHLVGTQRHSITINPDTGQPVTAIASITVVAPTTQDADLWTTVAGVHSPDDAVALLDNAGLGALVVAPSGELFTTSNWWSLVVESDRTRLRSH